MGDHASGVEVRRSKRRRRTVSAYRDGDRIVVLIPASMTRKPGGRVGRDDGGPAGEVRARGAGPATTTCCGGRAGSATTTSAGSRGPESVRWVDNQRSRWGSCTPGDRSIRLSARLQGMPAWVVDYVLVHELAHLLEAGHNERSGPGWTATRAPSGPRATWRAGRPRPSSSRRRAPTDDDDEVD